MRSVFALAAILGLASCSAPASGGMPAFRAIFARQSTASNIYVANEKCCGGADSALVFDASAGGDAKPEQRIEGKKTQLDGAQGIGVDNKGNIYVSSLARVTVYPPDASGNVEPSAEITGSLTKLDYTAGIAIDSQSNLYVCNHATQRGGEQYGDILIFAPGANGDAPPSRLVKGPATGLVNPNGVALDQYGGTYVTNGIDPSNILIYSAGASGNTKPIRQISGYQTGLNGTLGVTVDTNGEIFVADFPSKSIRVFAANASGDTQPIRVISGSKTGITYPVGVVSDGSTYIYVTNMAKPKSVLVFNESDNGNVAPVRTITGAKTLLYAPRGIAL